MTNRDIMTNYDPRYPNSNKAREAMIEINQTCRDLGVSLQTYLAWERPEAYRQEKAYSQKPCPKPRTPKKKPKTYSRSRVKRYFNRASVINQHLQDLDSHSLGLIELIYKNRPKGYHCDHIIPLKLGGKHEPNNLQYLPARINSLKGIKTDCDVSQYVIRWQDLLGSILSHGEPL